MTVHPFQELTPSRVSGAGTAEVTIFQMGPTKLYTY
jgi:hypothetical protein